MLLGRPSMLRDWQLPYVGAGYRWVEGWLDERYWDLVGSDEVVVCHDEVGVVRWCL